MTAKTKSANSNLAKGPSILLIGFAPTEEDFPGWKKSFEHLFAEGGRPFMHRTVWDNPDNRDQRVLVDCFECESQSTALERAHRLIEGDTARSSEPVLDDLLSPVYQQSPGFSISVVGNLVISVKRFGFIDIDTRRWALEIRELATLKPSESQEDLKLDVSQTQAASIGCLCVSFHGDPSCDEFVQLRFFGSGGELSLENGLVLFESKGLGNASLEGFGWCYDGRVMSGRLCLA